MKTLALSANGEGFGHVARMVAMVPVLSRTYRLILYAPSATHGFLREKLPDITEGKLILRNIPSLTFAKRGDRIDYAKTVRDSIPTLLKIRSLIRRLRDVMLSDGIEGLVSDFEPFSSWAASAIGIPVLQMNHPGIVTRSPSVMPDALAAKWVSRWMMGTWDSRFFVSFYDGDVGPMIRDDIRSAITGNDGSVVVYLKPGYRKPIMRAFKKLGITCYHFFPDAKKDYASTLASCKAVIAGGGHQTICESLFLGKPILAIPQGGQYEQRLNASMLEAGGYGQRGRMQRLTADIERFLADVDSGVYPKSASRPWIKFCVYDDSARAIERIHCFMEGRSASRIIPFRSFLLGEWLGPIDKKFAQ